VNTVLIDFPSGTQIETPILGVGLSSLSFDYGLVSLHGDSVASCSELLPALLSYRLTPSWPDLTHPLATFLQSFGLGPDVTWVLAGRVTDRAGQISSADVRTRRGYEAQLVAVRSCAQDLPRLEHATAIGYPGPDYLLAAYRPAPELSFTEDRDLLARHVVANALAYACPLHVDGGSVFGLNLRGRKVPTSQALDGLAHAFGGPALALHPRPGHLDWLSGLSFIDEIVPMIAGCSEGR